MKRVTWLGTEQEIEAGWVVEYLPAETAAAAAASLDVEKVARRTLQMADVSLPKLNDARPTAATQKRRSAIEVGAIV